MAIWLAGFALLLIRIIGGSLAVRRMARRAVPATGSIRFMAASISDGLTAANAKRYRGLIDGAIVGTSIKRGGDVAAEVDGARVRAVVNALKALR